MTYQPSPTPMFETWPRHQVSTGFPSYICLRKSVTPFVFSGLNQTTSPRLSMISGPACATTIFGARKRYPGAVPCAAVCTRTSGGFRSGREKKCCVGGTFCACAVVVAAGADGDALFLPLLHPATRIAKTAATKAASFTWESIIASGNPDGRRARQRSIATVERLHGYPLCSASKRNRRLEPGLRNGRDGTKRVLGRPGKESPLADLRRAVPARIQRSAGNGHRRWADRKSRPTKAVRPVGVDTVVAEATVEPDSPPGSELCEARLMPPAGEEVAVP